MTNIESENNRDALMERAMFDSAAFGTLYDMYYEKVFRHCVNRIRSRQIAEDITGAVFLSAAQDISRFRGKTRTEFLNWLFTIALAKIKAFGGEKQFSEFVNKLGADDLPDSGHKERLRAKILSSFNRPQPAKFPSRLFFAAALALILAFAGFVLWRYPSNKTVQKFEVEPQKSVEAELPQQIEKSGLEKIKKLTDDKNAPGLLPDNQNRTSNDAQGEKTRTILIAALDKKTSRPLPGVELEFRIEGQSDSVKAQTGEDGQYLFSMSGRTPTPTPTPGWFQIIAKKAGCANMRFSRHRSAEQEMLLPSEIIFEMSQVIEVGGFVENKQQEPVEAAEVRVYANYGFDSNMPFVDVIESVETDANGFWKCSQFPQDAYQAAVIAKHPDYAESESSLAAIEQLKSFSHIIILEKGVAPQIRQLDVEPNMPADK